MKEAVEEDPIEYLWSMKYNFDFEPFVVGIIVSGEDVERSKWENRVAKVWPGVTVVAGGSVDGVDLLIVDTLYRPLLPPPSCGAKYMISNHVLDLGVMTQSWTCLKMTGMYTCYIFNKYLEARHHWHLL